jgi:hypothetical protein
VIIDPKPIRLWGTYYGGNGRNAFIPLCKDDYVYLSGTTYSSNNITTTGANIIYYAYIDEYDAFLVKFNANGTRV